MGVISRRRNRPSNKRLDSGLAEQVLRILRGRMPTLVQRSPVRSSRRAITSFYVSVRTLCGGCRLRRDCGFGVSVSVALAAAATDYTPPNVCRLTTVVCRAMKLSRPAIEQSTEYIIARGPRRKRLIPTPDVAIQLTICVFHAMVNRC